MKLKLSLVFLLVLALSHNVVALADDALALDSEQANANSMTWPMLPGENLNDVARLFYPKNKALQKRFVFKTLRLSAENRPNLSANERFDSPTLLVIPTLKSLSNGTRAIKSGQGKSHQQKLKLSYDIEKMPAKLMQEYELLLSKNAFLKEELAKLNEKLIFLQAKLNELKLILDKTLVLPSNSVSTESSPIKKEFKNLNKAVIDHPQATMPEAQNVSALLDFLNTHLVKIILAFSLLALLGVYLFNKYQQYMFSKISFAATKMQATVQGFSGYIQNRLETKQELPEPVQAARDAKEADARLDSTLEEAKLLMSINRSSDAIAHLKMTIDAQPKASIGHWLYLLEIFRKLNLKEDFENFATELHNTFNVLTPVWYETEVAIYVSQSLEEFPHIMEKLYSLWPDEMATIYLRDLITDNRGGERTGFGKEVLSEILMLIAVLDMRKDLN